MVLTPSKLVPLGFEAPDFCLKEPTTGKDVTFADVCTDSGILVMFICNHCPYVKHVAAQIALLGRDYLARGLGVVAINSNDALAYPQDGPDKMVSEVVLRGYDFPYLFDETQIVANEYGAACTPDFFLFDGARRLVYRGQMDGSRPGNGQPTDGSDLRSAIDALLAGRPIPSDQKASLGCNIKWR